MTAGAPESGTRTAPFAEPFARFGEVLARARAEKEIREPTAMSIATVGEDGRPSLRMVLLKEFDERGFVFYTNLGSRKARELRANPNAALCFHYQPFEVQVRIEGRVEPVSDAEADAYYASRPRGSRVGAWASIQSTPLPSYDLLVHRVEEFDARFGPTGDIPRPAFWSGFRVVPGAIEFWQGMPSRLHQRDVYTLVPGEPPRWMLGHLYP
ncbi:MAG: Pyridoxamine 5'-phosphate oxidase [uncultured Gemmatimonadetes bacterium]|uniref:Pyridoxamine 5'-phosphate oxidase n=1 Tax=uncultured Gemmatimonadota bacterium TaxID=203437 RepID=A0A6J4KU65_9BACT|nr:MAG: Pyridoxamine 5'-phosphate oxidase [uncultured Gemmatimonadota bacterium]